MKPISKLDSFCIHGSSAPSALLPLPMQANAPNLLMPKPKPPIFAPIPSMEFPHYGSISNSLLMCLKFPSDIVRACHRQSEKPMNVDKERNPWINREKPMNCLPFQLGSPHHLMSSIKAFSNYVSVLGHEAKMSGVFLSWNIVKLPLQFEMFGAFVSENIVNLPALFKMSGVIVSWNIVNLFLLFEMPSHCVISGWFWSVRL